MQEVVRVGFTQYCSKVTYMSRGIGSGTFRRRRFGAAVLALDISALDISAPDISAPGLFGARTFFFRFVVL